MLHRLLVILLLGTLAAPATAGEMQHRLGPSETLADVAKRLYGATWKAVYLQARNDIDDPRSLAAGTRLYVPACWRYSVRRGDSAAAIAKRYLNDAGRYEALMQANGIKDATGLEVGRELLMPFHLRHKVAVGETLATISRRYYRTTRYAAMLKDYNGSSDKLAVGQRITVPIFDRATLDVQSRRYTPPSAPSSSAAAAAASPTSSSPPPGKPRRDDDGGADTGMSLREAVAAFNRGEFVEGCGALEALLEAGELGANDRATLVSHLGFCAVAFGDLDAARDYFRTWIEVDPKASLNPITTSPKIMAVFEEVAETSSTSEGARP